MRNISTAGKGGKCYAIQEKPEGTLLSLYAQKTLHQALAQVGELSMESVPLGYTLVAQKKWAKKYANRVGFRVLACATQNGDPIGNGR